MAWAVSCGAVQPEPRPAGPSPAATHAPLTPVARSAIDDLRRLADTARWSELAARVAAEPRPLPLATQRLYVEALWRMGREVDARAEETAFCARIGPAIALRTGDPHAVPQQTAAPRSDPSPTEAPLAGASDPAVLAAERTDALLALAKLHQQARRPEQAWHVLEPLLVGGCTGRAVCKRAASILAMLKPDAGWHARALAAAPSARTAAPSAGTAGAVGDGWRLRWLQDLANEWLPADGRALADLAVAQQPREPRLWLFAWQQARRLADPAVAQRWQAAVQTAPLTAADLVAMTTSADPPRDPAKSVELLALAITKPDATESTWMLWSHALARAGHKAAVLELQRDQLARLPSPGGHMALARDLIVVGALNEALELVRKLPADDAQVLVLEAEILRQRGQLSEALRRAQAVATAPGDRSSAGVLLAQLWRPTRAAEAVQALEMAADATGACQLAAAALVAGQAIAQGKPTPATRAQVQRYARLLRTPPSSTCLVPDFTLPPAVAARDALVRQLDGGHAGWHAVEHDVVRQFHTAGVASAASLRLDALRSWQEDDAEGFLVQDRLARAAADAFADPLADDPVLTELAKSTAGSASARVRWLTEADVQQADSARLDWDMARALLGSPFAVAARAWAEQALTSARSSDALRGLQSALVNGGAADLAWLASRARPVVEPQADVDATVLEVQALLALDRGEEARQRLLATARRTDLQPRHLRELADLGHDRGLCESPLLLAPRLLAGADVPALRSVVSHALDCVRRLNEPTLVPQWVALVDRQAEPVKQEIFAKLLAQHHFYGEAAALFDKLSGRPLASDALKWWATALVRTGRAAQAGQLFMRLAQLEGRGKRPQPFGQAAEWLEGEGQVAVAGTFWQLAVEADPEAVLWRTRMIANLMRRGELEPLPAQLTALLRRSPTADDLERLKSVAEHTGTLRLLYDALAAETDLDRDGQRFRLELAARLGLREPVEAGVRTLRAKTAATPVEVPLWLSRVGAWRQARDVAVEWLSAPDAGELRERVQAFEQALDLRRDASSADEALGLARLFVGRAPEPGTVALEAALELTQRGHAREAVAVAELAGRPDAAFPLCLRGQLAFDAGDRAAALQLWRSALAVVTLEPRLPYLLRSSARTRRELGDDSGQAIRCLEEALADAGERRVLVNWLRQQQRAEPAAPLVHALLLRQLAALGDVAAMVEVLKSAARNLGEFERDDFQLYAEAVVREGGAPAVLDWLLGDAPALRTEPWFVAWVAEVLEVAGARVSADRSAPLRRWLAAAGHRSAEVRAELAMVYATRRQPEPAVAWLGRHPLLAVEARVLPAAGGRRSAAQAVAAVLVALAGAGRDPAPWLNDWLATGLGRDARLQVAVELVRAGHPELVSWVGGAALLQGHEAQARQVLAVALATADDDTAAQLAVGSLRGRRQELRAFDELWVDVLRSGRVGVARRLAVVLAAEEPGVRPPPMLAALPTTEADAVTFERALQSGQPALVAGTPRADLAVDTAALDAVARWQPVRAEAWATALAARHDEAWRPWFALARAALRQERIELARQALERAEHARAPAAIVACPALALSARGTLAGCLRGRPLDLLPEPELADLAAAVALDLDPVGLPALQTELTRTAHSGQLRWLSAAAARAWAWTPAQKARLTHFLQTWLAALPPAHRRTLVVAAMDDLAPLGLAALAVAPMQAAFEADPEGHGQRNNLAYVQLLAGESAAGLREFTRSVEFDAGGDGAYASLDTLGAIAWAVGERPRALELQRRALWAMLAQPEEPARRQRLATNRHPELGDLLWQQAGTGVSLPLVRLAEFLLASGQPDDARVLAAAVLLRPDDSQTALRARRVLANLAPTPGSP
jgi:hypothetical protein